MINAKQIHYENRFQDAYIDIVWYLDDFRYKLENSIF
jgi:hypothetical protein